MPNSTPNKPEPPPTEHKGELDGLLCPDCDYNLTGLPTPRCPECGRHITPDDILYARNHRILIKSKKTIRLHLIIITMCASLTGILGGLDPWGWAQSLILLVYVTVVMAIGYLFCMMSGPHRLRRIWLQSMIWLHITWMVLPIPGWLIYKTIQYQKKAAMVNQEMNSIRDLKNTITTVAGCSIILLSMISFIIWFIMWQRLARQNGLIDQKGTEPPFAVLLLALFTTFICVMLGLSIFIAY